MSKRDRIDEDVHRQVATQLPLAERNVGRRLALKELVYVTVTFVAALIQCDAIIQTIMNCVLSFLRKADRIQVQTVLSRCFRDSDEPPAKRSRVQESEAQTEKDVPVAKRSVKTQIYWPKTVSTGTDVCTFHMDSIAIQTDEVGQCDACIQADSDIEMSSGNLCDVCMFNSIVCITICGHTFCSTCIKTQYDTTGDHRCPECRSIITKLIPLPGHLWSQVEQIPDEPVNRDLIEIPSDLDTESLPEMLSIRRPTANQIRVFPADVYSHEGTLPIDVRYIQWYYRVVDDLNFRCILCNEHVRNQIVILTEHLDENHIDEIQIV